MKTKYCLLILLIFSLILPAFLNAQDYPLSKSDIKALFDNYLEKLTPYRDKPIPPVQLEMQLLEKANKLMKYDKFDQVISICKKVTNRNPGSLLGNKLLGIAYFESSKLDQARKYLDRALPSKPDDPLILSYLGNFFEYSKKYRLAISFYSLANEREKDLISLEKIGKIYRKLKHYPEALIWFKKVKALSPSESIDYQTALTYFYLREFEFARFILKKYINQTKDPRIPSLYAKILQLEKKYTEAINYLERNNLDFKEKNLIMGISYYKLKQYKDAIKFLKKYMEKKPGSYAAGLVLSKIYIAQKSYGRAISTLKKLCPFHPEKYIFYIMLAECYISRENTDKAIEAYESAIFRVKNKSVKKELKDIVNEMKATKSQLANAKYESTPLSNSFNTVRTGGAGGFRRVSKEKYARINAFVRAKSKKMYRKLIKKP